MLELLKKNIKIIFIEHLYTKHIKQLQEDQFQSIIDHLNANAFMRMHKEDYPSPAKKMVEFLKECQTQGIKLIALDEHEIYAHNKKIRIPSLNARTVSLIEQENINEQNKGLVYIGAAHTNHHNNDYNITGIAEIIKDSSEIILKDLNTHLKLSSVRGWRE